MACDMKNECRKQNEKKKENRKGKINHLHLNIKCVRSQTHSEREENKRKSLSMMMIMGPMNQLNQIPLDFRFANKLSHSLSHSQRLKWAKKQTHASAIMVIKMFFSPIRAYWLNLITSNEYNISSFGCWFVFFFFVAPLFSAAAIAFVC